MKKLSILLSFTLLISIATSANIAEQFPIPTSPEKSLTKSADVNAEIWPGKKFMRTKRNFKRRKVRRVMRRFHRKRLLNREFSGKANKIIITD